MKELESKVEEFLIWVDKEYKVKFAYLFGSQARGEANDDSDIDIGIYFYNKYDSLNEAIVRGTIMEMGKEFFHKDVDIVSLRNSTLLMKYQVIKDGIVVFDKDERAEFESLSLRMYFDFKYYTDIYDNAMIDSIKNGDYFGG
ncbi:MAG: nucleotidyltransferase domain-containing protein [Clostridium sp.]|uniref:type VII toxin-antitoxin system MntA family adenylyltransferase antitoxin n=1 Tax=Clostridium sp. TaxID=1506 RepID=UPI00304EC15D